MPSRQRDYYLTVVLEYRIAIHNERASAFAFSPRETLIEITSTSYVKKEQLRADRFCALCRKSS